MTLNDDWTLQQVLLWVQDLGQYFGTKQWDIFVSGIDLPLVLSLQIYNGFAHIWDQISYHLWT